MRGLLARSGMTMMLLLTLSAGCARQPRALYTTYALGGGWCEATPTPIHAATDTAPGAPRFTLRGEVRTPPNGPALSNTRVLLYGPLNSVVHPNIAQKWLDAILPFEPTHQSERTAWAFCLTQLARKSGQRAIDIDDSHLAITAAGLNPLQSLPHLGALGVDAKDDWMPNIAAMPSVLSWLRSSRLPPMPSTTTATISTR